ncbi:hypothetical protein [Streptomyces sp. 1331.2]|uniref:hypothetical protein n=1 Tax=Streptomyces sp. 1331.2 TaxID=1938835 RepID=UPI000BD7FFC8|nr:hypothetical protein [Streptomyces sp. 1331.2]SOB88858.1 hypothetical protein SAMN06272789_7179 [Streptomyces sp. 1331.2]
MKHRIRGWTAALAATAAGVFGLSALAAADTAPPPAPPTDASVAPPAVEDFSYPGASGISNVKLLRGDGGIMLADCSTPTQIQLWTRAPGNTDNKICFTAPAVTGYLALELPDVFAAQTAGRAVRVGLTAAGASQSTDVPKDGFTGVGEGLGQAPTTVVELRVTG